MKNDTFNLSLFLKELEMTRKLLQHCCCDESSTAFNSTLYRLLLTFQSLTVIDILFLLTVTL